jgi:predicted ATPase/DNA-binding SARP family transcriptional activator
MGTQFNVLGPIEVRRADVVLTLTSTKQRLLLATLLIHANEVVAVGALIEALWTGRPPATARDVLQTYVSQLRKTIERAGAAAGGGTLRTVAPGYRLDVDPDDFDAVRFERLADVGCEHLRRMDPTAAWPVLRDAESLWRGPAYADLAGELAVTAEAERLEALRLVAVEARMEAAMALGHPGEALIAELEALVQAHPFRERIWAQLMRCLYRDGRQAEALDAYQRLRRLLADELGLTPAPELEALEHDILAHSPNLASMWPLRPHGRASPAHDTVGTPMCRIGTTLVGRVDELHAIDRLVQTERLVTIVGPGGVGKTHLATEVAACSPQPVVVVRLESVTDSAGAVAVLAGALEVGNLAGSDLRAASIDVLRSAGPRLVLVDNCEHMLADAGALIADVLERCPQANVLATSRARLGLPLEHMFRLTPLDVPTADDQHSVESSPAVELFIDRGRRARPEFTPTPAEWADAARIVQRLDGLPLAIEIAASRLSALSVADLAARVDRALDLTRGARAHTVDRHLTVRAAVEWSYGLLAEPHKRLFRHLAVFADGFDLDAVESIAGDNGLDFDVADALVDLVDASLVAVVFGPTVRYRLLDTLLSFGVDQLRAAGELDAANATFRRGALDVAERVATLVEGPDEPEGDRLLRAELGNLRAAWRASIDTGHVKDAVDLLAYVHNPANQRFLTEVFTWSITLADDPRINGARRAAVLAMAADIVSLHDMEEAGRLITASRAIDVGNDTRVSSLRSSVECAVVLLRGEFTAARDIALAAGEDGPLGLTRVVAALGAAYADELVLARELNEQCDRSSPSRHALYEYVLGEIAGRAQQLSAAERHYLAAFELAGRAGATFVQRISSVGLASVRGRRGDAEQALLGYRDLLDYWEQNTGWTFQLTTVRNLADLLEQLTTDSAAALRTDADRLQNGTSAGADEMRELVELARSAINVALARLSS